MIHSGQLDSSSGRLEIFGSRDHVSVDVSDRIGPREPIPQKAIVLAVVSFGVLADCPSRILVAVDVGGEKEFEVEPVKRDSDEGLGSLTGISTASESLVEENPEAGRPFFSVQVQSRCSSDDACSVFPSFGRTTYFEPSRSSQSLSASSM